MIFSHHRREGRPSSSVQKALFHLLAWAILLGAVSPARSGERPNVIVVMTDDQGYGDLSCHGNPIFTTPHLDDLHGDSVRLTDFHVAPMCTPTRGQFLTGRDAARNGAINVSSGRTLLRAELPTLADEFRGAGYQTGIFGKWHLGDTYPYRPGDRGFEERLWFPSSHINSVPDVWDNDYFDDTYRRNGFLTRYRGYCTDVFFTEAMAWMGKQAERGEPFLVYLPTNAPHTPYWLPAEELEAMEQVVAAAEESGKLRKMTPRKRDDLPKFLAMIKNIDDNMGRLERFLREKGIRDETIVIFLTDNGSTMGADYYNAGMWGRKTQLWEGGHRVPCFIRYPGGGLDGGRDIGGLTQVQDLFPSLLALAGIESGTPTDGMNLGPVLRGEESVPEDRMLIINYSRMPIGFDYPAPDSPSRMRREGAAVLWKRWRLLEDRELYDLSVDSLQRNNVIDEHPEVVARMRAHLDAWWSEVGEMANEPQPVVIGHEAENPVLLTACEWLDVFIDQQQQVRRADRKNGWWEIEVAEPGEYEFELRRWPRDADIPLSAGLEATPVATDVLLEGEPMPIAVARIRLGERPGQTRRVEEGATHVTFTTQLPAGRTRLYTWFLDERGQSLVGAYYVYVERR